MKINRLYAFRGATCTKNTKDDITKDVEQMFSSVIKLNNIDLNNLVSIQFTTTQDLTAINPAKALRKSFELSNKTLPPQAALFCSQEPTFEESIPLTIRVMILAYVDIEENEKNTFCPKSVYLNGAQVLRPDLCNC